jgi:RND family efflux transporter MFP subunit
MTTDDLSTLKIDRGPAAGGRRRFGTGRLLIAALVALALALAAYRTLVAPVLTVTAATVTRVYPSQTFTVLNASGYVVAQRKAAVASKGTGRLIWLGVEEGSVVTKGQVIARLESEDLRAGQDQAVANRALSGANLETARAQRDAAAANRDNARAQREVARAGVAQARAEIEDAAAARERDHTLFAGGMIAKVAFDASEVRHRKAQAALAAAESTLAGAESSVRAAEGSLAAAESALAAAGHAVSAAGATVHAARVNVGYTEIVAPFDGVVLTKNADVGDMVTPIGSAANARAAVVTMADPASLLVEADVSETSLPKVKVGQPCEVQLDSIPDARFPATVHMIVPTADRAKGTVLVKVRLAALDPRILPDMSAKVAFLERPVAAGEETARVAVSPRALTERAGVPTVFLLRENRAAAVRVVAGPKLGDLVVIVSGLSGGERVVLEPPAKLRDGSRVRVAEE